MWSFLELEIASHPVLLLLTIYILCRMLCHYGFLFYNRTLRHFNIRKHGYPPPHCDADGDFKLKENE